MMTVTANKTRGRLLYVFLVLLFITVSAGKSSAAQTTREDAYADNLSRWNVPVFNQGVGMAYAADARGVHGGLTNPAALSRIQTHQFSIEYQRWGENWDLFNSGIAVPMAGPHAYAFQFSWLDYGELEPLEEDELYRPQGNEFKGSFTYSFLLADRLALGASLGMMSSKMGFKERETEPLADLGLLLRLNSGFWLGVTGKNLNGTLKIDDKYNKLPPEYRAGAAIYMFEDRIGLTGDMIYIDTEEREDFEREDVGMAGGLRLLISESFRISAGYHSLYGDKNDAPEGYTGGVELNLPGLRWNLGLVDTGEETITRAGGTLRF
ncbi:MAG: hypothetical protein ACQEP7_01085 [bacterium]